MIIFEMSRNVRKRTSGHARSLIRIFAERIFVAKDTVSVCGQRRLKSERMRWLILVSFGVGDVWRYLFSRCDTYNSCKKKNNKNIKRELIL